jgi:hypothetical protein
MPDFQTLPEMAGAPDSVQVGYLRTEYVRSEGGRILIQFVDSLNPFLEVLSSASSTGTAFGGENTGNKLFVGSASSRMYD